MNQILPILAEGADEIIKLIFGGLFVLIWIVGGLMSATKKKPKTRVPEKSWDEIFRELSGEPKSPQQAQAPPPPLPPAARAEPRRPAPLQRPVPQPTSAGPLSAPPSGPAVRKKLRRRNQPTPFATVPPPPPREEPEPPILNMPVLKIAPMAPMLSDISNTEIGSDRPSASHTAGLAAAKQLRTSLRPENLRHQFILTELLQPPKALRGDV